MIELVMAIAIATLVSLMVLLGMHFITKAQLFIKDSAELEKAPKELSFMLPLYLGQAVNVDWTGGNINNINNGRGRIRRFTSAMTATRRPPVAIGVYLREAGNPSAVNARGDLRATGMYFRSPTPTTPGELIISSSGYGVGVARLSSDQPVQRFDNIVELRLRPGGLNTPNGRPVRVVEVSVVIRKFTLNTQAAEFWCPQANINARSPGCRERNIRNFRDISHTLYIPLVNNAIETTDFINAAGDLRRETLYGNIYFFKQTTVGE